MHSKKIFAKFFQICFQITKSILGLLIYKTLYITKYIETPVIYKRIELTRKFKFINRSGTSIKFERAGGGVVATNERASSLRPPEAEGRRHGSGSEGAGKFYCLRHFVACDILSQGCLLLCTTRHFVAWLINTRRLLI